MYVLLDRRFYLLLLAFVLAYYSLYYPTRAYWQLRGFERFPPPNYKPGILVASGQDRLAGFATSNHENMAA